MVIKPHHFMDIIKLYGGGIQVFVPDTDYGHDFYRAANEIIGNHRIQIKVTSGADDICGPCRFLGSDKTCTDCISHIKGIRSKNSYNKMLDCRIKAGSLVEVGFDGEKLTFSVKAKTARPKSAAKPADKSAAKTASAGEGSEDKSKAAGSKSRAGRASGKKKETPAPKA